VNLTRLAQALTDAGLRSPANSHRGLYMSLAALWFERASHSHPLAGIPR